MGYFKNLAVEAETTLPCGHDHARLVNWHRWIGPGQVYEDSTYCRECFVTDADGSRAADRVRRGGRAWRPAERESLRPTPRRLPALVQRLGRYRL